MDWRARVNDYFYDYYFGFHRRRVLRHGIVVGAVTLAMFTAAVLVLTHRTSPSTSISGGPTVTPPVSAAPAAVTPSSESTSPATIVNVPPSTDPATTSSGSTVATTRDLETTTSSTGDDGPSGNASEESASSTTDQVATVATLPDGQPVPALAVFDASTIALSGEVPSRTAADRLAFIVVSRRGSSVQLIDNLAVSSAVPINVGVRVVDLDAESFRDNSADIAETYTDRLNSIVEILRSLPHVSVLVIGHAGQPGHESENFTLASDRARAVVDYLAYSGIAADRISSRAAGATDVFSTQGASIATANPRVEFVLYGLLIP